MSQNRSRKKGGNCDTMPKTDMTKKYESILIEVHQREYGCPEVTMGIGTSKGGRVDYLVMDSKGILKCYEIKVTKADFRSTNINSFEGHYNYYAMPESLFEEIQGEIPDHIGVVVPGDYPEPHLRNVKRARKQKLSDEQQLKLTQYLTRSLARDANRYYEIQNEHTVPKLKTKIRELSKDRDDYQQKADKYLNKLFSLENDLDIVFGKDFEELIHAKAMEITKRRTEGKKCSIL